MTSTLEVYNFGGPPAAGDVERWRELCAESFLADSVWPVSSGRRFSGELLRRWVGDCLILRFRTDPFAGVFAPGSQAAGYIGFGVFGPPVGERLSFHDRSPAVEIEHTLGVWDNGNVEGFQMRVPKEQTYLMVPKCALRGSGVRLAELATGLVADEKPTARILSELLGSILGQREPIAALDSLAIRNAVIDLIRGTAREATPLGTEAVSGDMRQRVERWIMARIAYGTVSPAAAAAEHGISVRSLHRLFTGSGTSFGETVRTLRVERARHDLACTSDTVQAIAARWGYADASHLCREFKRAYELTPTEFRGASASAGRTTVAAP